MRIDFQKIQGAGNDFVIFDNRDESVSLTSEQVQHICDRHFGVGADGVIEVRLSTRPGCSAYMHYLNADGSLAEMCGNGVRCFALYLIRNGLLTEKEMEERACVVDTLAGPRPLDFVLDEEGVFVSASVCMGEPLFAPGDIPTTLPPTREITLLKDDGRSEEQTEAVVQSVIFSDDTKFVITCVNMGNPHAVMFLEHVDALTARAFTYDPDSLDLEGPGSFLESNTDVFPQKTNVEIAAVNGNNKVRMRVYERGVGETLACGTGACAAALTAIILGEAHRDEPVTVEVSGGTLEVMWLPSNEVLLTGPAQFVFDGTMTFD